MKTFVTFKQQNPDFDKQYAEEYHFGKESDGNWKDLCSKRLLVEEVHKILLTEKGSIELLHRDNDKEIITLSEMVILKCYKDEKIVATFAVSKSLLKNTHQTYSEKYDITRFYFYFNPTANGYIELLPGIYVAHKELPQELLIAQNNNIVP